MRMVSAIFISKEKLFSIQALLFQKPQNRAFQGKHSFAKGFAGIAGLLGTAGAVGGILIMTGGLGAAALPWILGYGAASAGAGAVVGHQLDKTEDKDK